MLTVARHRRDGVLGQRRDEQAAGGEREQRDRHVDDDAERAQQTVAEADRVAGEQHERVQPEQRRRR